MTDTYDGPFYRVRFAGMPRIGYFANVEVEHGFVTCIGHLTPEARASGRPWPHSFTLDTSKVPTRVRTGLVEAIDGPFGDEAVAGVVVMPANTILALCDLADKGVNVFDLEQAEGATRMIDRVRALARPEPLEVPSGQ